MQEVIKLEQFTIEQNLIYVSSSSTAFVYEYRLPAQDPKNIIKRFNAMVKAARAQGVTVSNKYKTKQFIVDNIQEYLDTLEVYNKKFDELSRLVKSKFSKPLYVGYHGDKELNVIYNLRNEIKTFNYRDAILSKFNEFSARVEQLEDRLCKGDSGLAKIYF